ncbi:hypothetical protein GCM10025787_24950 [Saccharopolyspora rosea]|uniref:Phage tail protein (Tail_P2_I) n=1 Tax=Saccharopolyspora rosea TaxID=524884 RepID=A0ABW3FNM9_9PSEU
MNGSSGYLRYLPPVLWEEDERADPSAFSLGAVLRIFEKILTGIDDDVPIALDDRVHPPITDEIARLDGLCALWKTPERFLPWLASWVAVEFPTLQGEQVWDEYQRRKVTAEIAGAYGRRGIRAGLDTFLGLFAVGRTRPRVALDDGSRVLVAMPGSPAPVAALVTRGPARTPSGDWIEGLMRPWCVAAGAGGVFFVGDSGVPPNAGLPLRSRVWRLSSAGHLDLAGTPPTPRPLVPDTPLTSVVAVAVRPAQDARPETLYVLDRSRKLLAVPAPYTAARATEVTTLASGLSRWPVAMDVDSGGDLLVLDRGNVPGNPSRPQIITVHPDPVTVTPTSLRTVVEPLSLHVQPGGWLIVGDAGDPSGSGAAAGNLVRVDRGGPSGWSETPLLPPSNPLVAPTAVTTVDETRLHVLDAGLAPFWPSSADPFVLDVAEPAVVHRVDLGATPTTTQHTESGRLVNPTGMATDGELLICCDPGQNDVARIEPFWSRLRPFELSVVIHFTNSRLPSDPDERRQALDQAVGNVRAIVEQNKPAHARATLVTAI